MTYVVPAPAPAAVAVHGTDQRFPVRRIFCVGRNYAAHAVEMGGDPAREPPFFFTKPADAVVPSGSDIPFPPATQDLHHEVELVLAIGTGGAAIPRERAMSHVYGYAVGLDMTRRDLQAEAKRQGRPWDMAKGFDQSAPMGAIVPAALVPDIARAAITLDVNGERRQTSRLDHMIWQIDEIVAHLSGLVELAPGDLVMTGTPEGVAAVRPGDRLVGGIEGLPPVEVRYRSAQQPPEAF